MADDQIYNYISDYINGVLTKERFWVLAKSQYPTHQINFCTQQALECLTFKGSEEVIAPCLYNYIEIKKLSDSILYLIDNQIYRMAQFSSPTNAPLVGEERGLGR